MTVETISHHSKGPEREKKESSNIKAKKMFVVEFSSALLIPRSKLESLNPVSKPVSNPEPRESLR